MSLEQEDWREPDEEDPGRFDSTEVLDRETGEPRLCAEMCPSCIFRPGNLMRLRPGRLLDLVNNSLQGGGFIPCHCTIIGPKNPTHQQPAICRGFFDRFGDRSQILRIWGRVGQFDEIDPAPQQKP